MADLAISTISMMSDAKIWQLSVRDVISLWTWRTISSMPEKRDQEKRERPHSMPVSFLSFKEI